MSVMSRRPFIKIYIIEPWPASDFHRIQVTVFHANDHSVCMLVVQNITHVHGFSL